MLFCHCDSRCLEALYAFWEMAQSEGMAPIAEGQSAIEAGQEACKGAADGIPWLRGAGPTSTLSGSLSCGATYQCPWAQESVAGVDGGLCRLHLAVMKA